MKNFKTAIALLLALSLCLGMLGCTVAAQNPSTADGDATPAPATDVPGTSAPASGAPENMLTIGILQYVTHNALDAAREGFIKALADNGFTEGVNVTFDVQNAQADTNNLSTMSNRFVNNKVDLVLAIATPAAQSIASLTTTIPVLFTAVTDPVDARLVASAEAPGGNVTGTNDMNPIAEQFDLLVKLVPEAKTVGILYTSSEDNSVLQAAIAKAEAEKRGLSVVEQTVTNANDVQQAAQSLVGKCDAVYIPTDNTLASAIPTIGAVAEEAKIPLICGEANMVLGGGLATLGINYYNLGYQTGEMAVRVLNGESTATMPVESLKEFDFTINGNVADAIGVTIPEDLKAFIVRP
ncbi:MAG: ABC transporter substrate-binding protein [Clostridiaceae bacterium]|nr:ABC transporter substrate-binding protein [Eubacteriales bacterium]